MTGWPVLVHFCDSCGYNTPVDYKGTVWIEEHTCTHCGAKSTGADVAGQSKGAMNTYQHDELAQLFAQLSTQQHEFQRAAPTAPQAQPPPRAQYEGQAETIVERLPMCAEKVDAPITFASAHYTHSSHLHAETQSEPARSPPPPYRETLMPEAMAETLIQNSIDPSALLPNQIELFVNADYEQRLRLLELWRIAPPSYPLAKHLHLDAYSRTSVSQEEMAARERYEQQMRSRTMRHEEHMLDTYIARPNRETPVALGQGMAEPSEAEPYMMSGYEKHSDPVYAAGMWQAPSYTQSQPPQHSMEDQYGMYEQIRNHADWERMNQQTMQQRMGGDEDMVM